jgi:hypothetical protein
LVRLLQQVVPGVGESRRRRSGERLFACQQAAQQGRVIGFGAGGRVGRGVARLGANAQP